MHRFGNILWRYDFIIGLWKASFLTGGLLTLLGAILFIVGLGFKIARKNINISWQFPALVVFVYAIITHMIGFQGLVTPNNIVKVENEIAAEILAQTHAHPEKRPRDRLMIEQIRPAFGAYLYPGQTKIVGPPTASQVIREGIMPGVSTRETHVTISQDPNGSLMINTEFPGDDIDSVGRGEITIEQMFVVGAVHRFDGSVVIGDFKFVNEGDPMNRLAFVMMQKGYVYLRGKGIVIPLTRDYKDMYGDVIRLGQD